MVNVTGHGLRHEGQRWYDVHGHNVGRAEGTHGKCACGRVFRGESDREVQRAHREHKAEILRTQETGGAT